MELLAWIVIAGVLFGLWWAMPRPPSDPKPPGGVLED